MLRRTAPSGLQAQYIKARKRHFLSHLYIKCIILPRQARDKHRENSKKSAVFPGLGADHISKTLGKLKAPLLLPSFLPSFPRRALCPFDLIVLATHAAATTVFATIPTGRGCTHFHYHLTLAHALCQSQINNYAGWVSWLRVPQAARYRP